MADLSSFPAPHLAIDVAVLTVTPTGGERAHGALAAVVLGREEEPRGHVLPGRFLRPGESIDECVTTALRTKAHVVADDRRGVLLRAFDGVDRDPRGWTVSLGHALALPHDRLGDCPGRLVAVNGSGAPADGSRLLFDHDEILRAAVRRIRGRYELSPDPDGLLDGTFTLAELRRVHEAVLGARVRRDTFRRRMEPALDPVTTEGGDQLTRTDGGRPARLWRARSAPAAGTDTTGRIALPRA